MTCKTCNGFGYLLTAPSTCSAGGERRSCPVCAPDAAASEAGEVAALAAELRPLIDAAAGPNGWDWMFPLRVKPVDGKPTIVSHKGGNLFRGYIGTWQEAELLVALANAAPRILAALTTQGGAETPAPPDEGV